MEIFHSPHQDCTRPLALSPPSLSFHNPHTILPSTIPQLHPPHHYHHHPTIIILPSSSTFNPFSTILHLHSHHHYSHYPSIIYTLSSNHSTIPHLPPHNHYHHHPSIIPTSSLHHPSTMLQTPTMSTIICQNIFSFIQNLSL